MENATKNSSVQQLRGFPIEQWSRHVAYGTSRQSLFRFPRATASVPTSIYCSQVESLNGNMLRQFNATLVIANVLSKAVLLREGCLFLQR